MSRRFLFPWLMVGLGMLATLSASGNEPKPVVSITPKAPSAPVLRYALLPPVRDQISGNAVVYYGKVKAEQNAFFSNEAIRDQIYSWPTKPLEELRQELTANGVAPRGIYYFLRQGARCDHADWQLPIREGDYFSILLPDIQESRVFAHMIAAKARWEIAHGRYPEALETIQTGFALARHVADGPTLVQGLVGISICELMFEQLEALTLQPDAPNLYWSLQVLPRPIASIESGLFAEYDSLGMNYRRLLLEDDLPNDEQWWGKQLSKIHREIQMFSDQPPMPVGGSPIIEAAQHIAEVTAAYPIARKVLIDAGYDETEVEAMPASKVVILGSWQRYQERRDQWFRLVGLDYPTVLKVQAASKEPELELIYPFVKGFLIPADSISTILVRQERARHRLVAIEALRAYAATHEGNLPASLDELVETPIPNDPATGKPYVYELKEGTAILSGPQVAAVEFRLEVKVVK